MCTRIHATFLILITLYGLFQAYQWRDIANSIDLVAYLDIGDALFRGDLKNAINPYWSPMYSWILGLVMVVFKPPMEHELLAVRLTNFGTVLFYTFAFIVFARTCWRYLQQKSVTWLSEPQYWFYMYSLLSFTGLALGGSDKASPDVLVGAFVVLASSYFLKIITTEKTTANFALMGTMLGLAYLAKAIVLPVSFFYYVGTWWETRKDHSALKNLALAAACEAVIAVPWVVCLSMTTGYFTFSDAPRNFFLWAENQRAQQVHYQLPGQIHTSRKVYSEPDVFEFAKPFDCTYPPWVNAAYWTEGAVDPEPTARKIRYFRNNIPYYLLEIFSMAILGFVAALLYLRRPCTTGKSFLSALPLMAPALVAMACYSISTNLMGHMMERYFIPWVVLLYAGILVMANFPADRKGVIAGRILTYTISASMLLVVIVLTYFHYHMTAVLPYSHDVVVARKLQELGLKPGDKIAQLPTSRRYFWARLLRLKIVADIADADKYLKLPPEKREEVLDILRQYGVKAIVHSWLVNDIDEVSKPDTFEPGPDWIKVPPTHAWIYILPAKSSTKD